MKIGTLIETTNEYALAEVALNEYIRGNSSLLEAYANADMYVLSETVTKKFSFGQNGTNVTVNKRGIQYDPSEYEQHERNSQYVYDTPLNTRIEDIKKSAAKIGIDVSKLSKEELEDLALDDLAMGDHNITGRNLAVSARNMLDDYLDSNENLSRKEKKELRSSDINITNRSIVMGKEKVFNNSVPSSNEKPSISPSKASEKIISVPNYKPPEPENLKSEAQQQAQNISNVVKPEDKKESKSSKDKPSMSQQEKQETIVKTQQQMRKVLNTSEDKPKSVLARMVSSLQNLYRKWLDKKNQAKSNGGDVGFFSNILRVILNCIDKLMWKIRNWSDGRKSNHYNSR